MFNLQRRLVKLLVLFFIIAIASLTTYKANSQQPSFAEHKFYPSTQEMSKADLASEVLQESGIAQIYDMHFDHLLGTVLGNGSELELYSRFRKMFVREVGWTHFKDDYVARLAADFSEEELNELLNLSKQPVMQKLLQSEVKVYLDTSERRFRMGFELWDNYNMGRINLPSD